MNAITYSVQEAVASLWRGRRSAALSVVTIAAALFVLGALLVVTWNIEQVLARWSAAAEMSVYLRDDVSPDVRAGIEDLLRASELVAEHAYVSKADALVRFRQDFSDLADVTDDLAANPLPASFDVRLRPEARDNVRLVDFARGLQAAAGVTDVRYDHQWIERVASAVTLMRAIGAVIVSILVLAAALTVANVVRLACHARRDEIEIMELVGAPLIYVRGPFVMEGVLQGGIGAVAAVTMLGMGFLTGQLLYGQTAADVLGVESVRFLPWSYVMSLTAGGMLVGCIGGLVAATGAGESPAGMHNAR
jgi:cell division transport system permease protein